MYKTVHTTCAVASSVTADIYSISSCFKLEADFSVGVSEQIVSALAWAHTITARELPKVLVKSEWEILRHLVRSHLVEEYIHYLPEIALKKKL